jgi:hypothetical protein
MNIQPSLASTTEATVPSLLAKYKRNDVLLFIVVFSIVLSLTPLLILGGITVGFSLVVGILAGLVIAVLVVQRPLVGFFVALGCVVLIEEFPLAVPILTDQLNVFYWPPRLQGLIERPIGFLFILILVTFACQQIFKRQRALAGGKLFWPFMFYLLCVAVGVVHGLTSGGTLKIVVVEVRPIWYLFVSYLLGYNLVTHKKHIRVFLWVVILGAGVKTIQGLYIYLIVLHGSYVGQNEIMAHEESFFFAALILLVILFCLCYRYRPQLYVALLILPGAIVVMIANQRRADYIALLLGIAVAWALLFVAKPQARKALAVGALITAILGGGYIAAFSQSSGGFAEPARAIVSIIRPAYTDFRDVNSNYYRLIENADLKYTVKQSPLIGYGFGKQFLQPYQLPDISAKDPYYLYIPHNTIYWIWMRLGLIGYFALWYLFGSVIVRGSLIVRKLRDPYLQLMAIYIVAITFMQIIVAFADYQFFFYRNVIYFGLLIGLLMKLPALDEEKEAAEA